jgi:hypothetical protein
MRSRIILSLIGVVLSIPTSVFGLQWMGAKLVTQQVGCLVDSTNAQTTWFTGLEQGNPAEEMTKMRNDLKTCVEGIDARKGTIEFAKEQYKRYH